MNAGETTRLLTDRCAQAQHNCLINLVIVRTEALQANAVETTFTHVRVSTSPCCFRAPSEM